MAPIDDPDARRRASIDGGLAPRWSPDGGELVYVDLNDTFMALAFSGGPPIKTGRPRPLFSVGRLFRNPGAGYGEPYYDLAPDGQSFLSSIGSCTTRPSSQSAWYSTGRHC